MVVHILVKNKSELDEKCSMIDEEEYKNMINKGNCVLIFSAIWCGPCKRAYPVIEKLSEKYQTVNFIKIDVEDFTEIAEEKGIKSLPTYLIFTNGTCTGKYIGEKQIELLDLQMSKIN